MHQSDGIKLTFERGSGAAMLRSTKTCQETFGACQERGRDEEWIVQALDVYKAEQTGFPTGFEV